MKTRGTVIRIRSILALLLVFSLVASFFSAGLSPQKVEAVSDNVVISQVYGGGGLAGAAYQNDFVELFNRWTNAVPLTGWSLQYASATGTFNSLVTLSGTIQPGQYFLVQLASNGANGALLPTPDLTPLTPFNMGSTRGKVLLAINSTLIPNGSGSDVKDLVGWGTGTTFYEGARPAPATSPTSAIFRNNGGQTDTDNNNTDFTAGLPAPRNTAYGSPTNPTGVGAANPDMLFAGDSTLLTVAVTPGTFPDSTGLTVAADLTSIGGSATQTLYDDGTHGDVTAGDNVFSCSTTVDIGTTAGTKSLACTIIDTESRSGNTSIQINILEIIPIGTVQGPVGDGDNGTEHRSPYAPPSGNGSGETVTVQGVIYEKTLQATDNPANTYKGFFIQNTSGTMDADPNTSDGLFVFMNTSSTMNGPGGSPYTPAVGDEVVITGTINEYYYMTELSNPTLVKPVVRSGLNLETEVPAFEVNPLPNLADANRYWERREGMRAQVPAGSIVLGGYSVFSPADADLWLARPDSEIAQRADPYERRAFRDAHQLDDNYDPNNWDGNGYRIVIGSLGIKETENNAQALINPARTFSILTNAPVGGVNYIYGKYRIEISEQPILSEGVDPAANNPPQVFDPSNHYSIMDYDLENLYDYRDNPASACDFPGNPGYPVKVDPFLDTIQPPFSYLPASDADYQAHLEHIARQIVNDLHSPDILMFQGIEN